MLKATGHDLADLMRIVIMETLVVTFLGGLAGVLLALLGGGLIESFISNVPMLRQSLMLLIGYGSPVYRFCRSRPGMQYLSGHSICKTISHGSDEG